MQLTKILTRTSGGGIIRNAKQGSNWAGLSSRYAYTRSTIISNIKVCEDERAHHILVLHQTWKPACDHICSTFDWYAESSKDPVNMWHEEALGKTESVDGSDVGPGFGISFIVARPMTNRAKT